MSHIIIKTASEIQAFRESGAYLSEILTILRDAAKPWVSLLELDQIAQLYCQKHDVKASFRSHQGFPAHVCLSLDDCLVHGIPNQTILKDGDFLKIDMGITHKGMISDAAISVVIWWDDKNLLAADLSRVTKEALDIGIKLLWPWVSVYDRGKQVEQHMNKHWYSVIHSLCGHGVGRKLREPPFIYNYADQDGKKSKFRPGMIIALEPITAITSTDYRTKGKNTRNLYTTDGDLGCQWEYSILITESGYEVLAGVQ